MLGVSPQVMLRWMSEFKAVSLHRVIQKFLSADPVVTLNLVRWLGFLQFCPPPIKITFLHPPSARCEVYLIYKKR